jgi:hypothetical protein
MRPFRAVFLVAALAVSVACETIADPYLPQSAINVTITNTDVTTQRSALPAPQIAIWEISEISAHDITGFDGTFEFLQASPCTYQLNAVAPIALSSACRMSGLSLKPSGERTAVVHITLTGLELRAAARPDLSLGADPDGDGVPNSADNCPIVFNPDQLNVNEGSELLIAGDACSKNDTSVPPKPTIADQDLDGVRDALDNCLFYPSPVLEENTAPVDANRDGIGDVCERIAPVVIPTGSLAIECPVTFTPVGSKISLFRMDFGAEGVLTCDAGFTGCVLNPAALQLELTGTTETFDCHPVP